MITYLVIGMLAAVYLLINLLLPLFPWNAMVKTYLLQPALWVGVIAAFRWLPGYRPLGKINKKRDFVLLGLPLADQLQEVEFGDDPHGAPPLVEHGQSADAVSDHQGDCMVNGVVHVDGDDVGSHEILGLKHTVFLKASRAARKARPPR